MTSTTNNPDGRPMAGGQGARFRLRSLGLAAAVAASLGLASARAAVVVETLAGGPTMDAGPAYGFADGNSLQQAQFNTPAGILWDSGGFLYVADRYNGRLRRLDLAAQRTKTVLSFMNQPIALAMDSARSIYVACAGDGAIWKYDRYGNSSLLATLAVPTALATDGKTNLFVTEWGGGLKRVALTNGVVTPITNGLNQPLGLAWLDSGLLAVSDSGSHLVRLMNPASGETLHKIGTGAAGFRDGPYGMAQFYWPHQLAKAPNGGLAVADRYNHRVRFISIDGSVTTLFGIDSQLWEQSWGTAGFYPGWADGEVEFAESREPSGVAVSSSGTVYDSELYYHLIRQATGSPDTAPISQMEVPAPEINPSSGFYPMGVSVTVTYPDTSWFLPTEVYYTTDGTDPTTNSFKVTMINGVGTILWRDSSHDLSFLRIIAFVGGRPSAIVSGQKPAVSEIGIPSDLKGGIGSTLVVPIVINMATNKTLKSVQFRVEVAPEPGTDAVIPAAFRALTVTNEPFLPTPGPAQAGKPALFSTTTYVNGKTRGLAVTYLGTNAGFTLNNFGMVALLALPVPPTAGAGNQYKIKVLQASGTGEANQRVDLQAWPERTLTVTNIAYLVGDTATAAWYGAGEFGDGHLQIDDVNNAFNAALGYRVPFQFTDAFDALDAFPPDTATTAGGDGQIRYLDWQLILQRSLGLDANYWKRSWAPGGVRVPVEAGGPAGRMEAASRQSVNTDGVVWKRQATVGALPVERALPNTFVEVPVYLKVEPGCRVAGLSFRASITPALAQTPEFVPAPGQPGPTQVMPIDSDLLCAWSMVPAPVLSPALQNSNLLGYVRFLLPYEARRGEAYQVHFSFVDGSPDLATAYDLQSIPATVWVDIPASRPPERISDEWKINFFGATTNPLADTDADADGDQFNNLIEFISGTDPLAPDWHYKADPSSMMIRWFAEAGRRYVVERSPNLKDWTPVGEPVQGDGRLRVFQDSTVTQAAQFYRVRLSQN